MIIHSVVGSQKGLGVSELAKRLKMGKSTVHGITSALEDLGVLVREPIHKKYSVGYTLLELGKRAYSRMELRDIARSPMERLMESVYETVFLGVVNGDHITILDVVESPNEMKITSPPGTRIPLLAGAAGKVFLSQLEQRKVKEILKRMELIRYTKNSIVDPKRFLEEVEEAKRNGYAVDDEEYLLGVRAVASPIQGISGTQAAIWVVGFTSRLNDEKMKRVVEKICETTDEINKSLKR